MLKNNYIYFANFPLLRFSFITWDTVKQLHWLYLIQTFPSDTHQSDLSDGPFCSQSLIGSSPWQAILYVTVYKHFVNGKLTDFNMKSLSLAILFQMSTLIAHVSHGDMYGVWMYICKTSFSQCLLICNTSMGSFLSICQTYIWIFMNKNVCETAWQS